MLGEGSNGGGGGSRKLHSEECHDVCSSPSGTGGWDGWSMHYVGRKVMCIQDFGWETRRKEITYKIWI